MTPRFRLRPSAAIVRDGSILLVEYDEPGAGVFCTLPGGGLQPDEPMHEGLRREIREEAGIEIEVGPLLLVWERTGGRGGPYHQVGFVFRCGLAIGSEPHKPEPGDTFQIGLRWVPLDDLPRTRLLPEVMARRLADVLKAPDGVDPFVAGHW